MYVLLVDVAGRAEAESLLDTLAGVPTVAEPTWHDGHVCAGFEYGGAMALAIRLALYSGIDALAVGIDTAIPHADTPCRHVPACLDARDSLSRRAPIAVRCPAHPSRAQDVEDALALIAPLLARRTAKQWKVVHLLERGLTGLEAAEELGITKQAVSRHRAASHIDAEHAGWELAVRLLERCETDLPPH